MFQAFINVWSDSPTTIVLFSILDYSGSLNNFGVAINYQISFQYVGSRVDAITTFNVYVSKLQSSITSGNFSSALSSYALMQDNAILARVSSSYLLSEITYTFTSMTIPYPTYSPSITPTKLVLPTTQPSTRPSESPTSTPTSYPSSTTQLPHVVAISLLSTQSAVYGSITLTAAKLLTSGTIYCIASTNTSVRSFSLLQSYGVSASFQNMSDPVPIKISGLIPAKDYYVYCALSLSGYKSSPRKVFDSKTYVRTSCCRKIKFTNSPSYVYGDLSMYPTGTSSSTFTFTYTISYATESLITVTPVLSTSSNTSSPVSTISIIPAVKSFTSSSTISSSFILSSGTYSEGYYSISLIATDVNGTSSQIYEGSTTSFSLLSSQSPLPAPNISSALFSDTGASVYVLFSSATDSAGFSTKSFPCFFLFTFVNADKAGCLFVNSSAVSIIYTSASNMTMLVPGNKIALLPGLIRAECVIGSVCTKNIPASSKSVTVSLPLTPLYPTVIVNLPAVVSSCNNLTVDATYSYGHGGRSWKSAVWDVSSSKSDSKTVSIIKTYLTKVSYAVNQIITLPSSILGAETYTVSLVLTNFLGYSSTGVGVIAISGDINLPVLTVPGGTTASFYAYQTVSVSCVASVSSCATTSNISYASAIYLNNVKQSFVSSAIDPRTFKLSPYTLTAGNTYRLQFNASSSATTSLSAVASVSVLVTINRGLVVSSVQGGYSRKAPVDKSILLDAGNSYDEDSVTSSLTYLWSCSISSRTGYGTDCSSIIPTRSASSITIPAYTLNSTYVYSMAVLVSSSDGRSSSSSVVITPIAAGAISVQMLSELTVINRNSKLSLSCYIVSSKAFTASWAVYYSGKAQNISSSSVSKMSYTQAEALRNITFTISYSPNSFVEGRLYTFQLTAYPNNASNLVSSTEISITINIPPYGGVLSASPASGKALSTVFSILCTLWTSNNLPLKFMFTYQISSIYPELTIGSLSLSPSLSTTLPSGVDSNSVITIYNYAYDVYSGSSSISTTVISKASSSDVTAILTNALSTSLKSGNVDGAVQAINNIASVVNVVDCSLAPDSYCASLNRNACQKYPNTCGLCLTGYKGIADYVNVKCINSTSFIKVGTQTVVSDGSSGSYCSSNSDCEYGYCVSNRCAIPSKTCPSSTKNTVCSGTGTCLLFDSSGNSLSACLVINSNCFAQCVCNQSYTGVDCSLDPTASVQRDALRLSLCDGISSVYSSQGASASLLQTLAGSLQSSFQPDEVVSSSALSSCNSALSIVTSIASQGFLTSVPTSTLTVITSTISSFIAKAAAESSSSSTTVASDTSTYVKTAIKQFTTGLVSTIADGDAAIELVSDNFQINVQRALVSTLSKSYLTAPQTVSEKAYSAQSPRVKMLPSGISACEFESLYAPISMAKFLKNPNPASQNLKTPTLIMNTFTTTSSSRRLTSSATTIKLSPDPLFYVVLPFSIVQDFNFSLDITSSSFNRLNPHYELPACTIYNGNEYVPCTGCNISSFTNYNVTYGCYDISLICGSTISSSSRRLSSVQSIGTEFGTILDLYRPPTSSPTSFPTSILLLPHVEKISLKSFKTSIIAAVSLKSAQMQTSGYVLCLATTNASMNSYAFIKSYGVIKTFANMSSPTVVTLTGLIPSTTYYVFCALNTVYGYKSSSSKIAATKTSVKTLCCREIAFTSTPAFVYGDLSVYPTGASAKYTFYFTISYFPESSLTLTPNIVATTSTSSAASSISIIPSSFTFSSLSTSTTAAFILSGNEYTEGYYSISFSLSSTDATVSAAYSVNQGSARIISSNSPLPAPNMTKAIFSDNGASISISFSVATDLSGISSSTFLCSKLFSGLSSSTCSFVNATFVQVTSVSTTVVPGGQLKLLSGLLKAQCIAGSDCSKNEAAGSLKVSILSPSTPLYPSVILNLPSQSGGCNNLSIDATSSTGNGGRAWKSVVWTVSSFSSSSTSVSSIQSYLSSNGLNVNQLVIIPSTLLSSETYKLTLTLTNFLGFSSSASKSVTIVGNVNLPTLTIVGGSTASFYAYQTVFMSCQAIVSSCATTNQINYTSAVFLSGKLQILKSSSSDPRTFKLAPYSLSSGYTYQIKFNATALATSKYPAVTATTSGYIEILRGSVISKIRGGSTRQFSLDKLLLLDASSSSDEDSLTAALTYRWSCTISSITSYGSDCSSVFGSSSTTASTISVAPYTLLSSLSYTFQVLVSSVDGRTSTSSVFVQPTGAGGVTVSITSLTSLINVDRKLSLSGVLFANYTSSSVQVFAFWSVYFSGSLVDVTPLTSASSNFTSAEVKKSITYPLAYSANTFVEGRTYSFRLTAYPTYDKSLASYTETTITINKPPSGGSVSLSPSSGDALSTSFYIFALLWTSSNLPLQYSFTYQVSSSQNELTIRALNQISYTYSTLPAGTQANSYQLTIKNYAVDSYSAQSVAVSAVSPVVKVNSNANITNILSSSLSNSFSSGNVDGAVQAVNNIASTVNIVNCTLASSTFCASMNRDVCSSVPNTCGSCLTGFKGIVGNANTKCFNSTSSSSIGSVGSACVSNSDCLYGLCRQFACIEPNKTCASSSNDVCSGNGVCKFFDSSNNVLDKCLQTNVRCSAKCVCDSGYGGSDCSLNPAATISRNNLRATLCEAINTVYASKDDSSSTLDILAGSLQTSFVADELVTDAGVTACTTALSTITTLASQGYLKTASSSTITTITSALSSFVAKASALTLSGTSSLDTSFASDALKQLSTGVLQTLVSGEDPSELVSDNFQSSISKSRLSTLAALSPPQTESESTYGAISPKLDLDDTGLDALDYSDGYAQIAISKYSQNPNRNSSDVKTSLLQIQIAGKSSSVSTASRTSKSSISTESLLLTDSLKTSASNDYISFTPLFYLSHQFSTEQDFNFSADIFSPSYVPTSNFTFPACSVYDSASQSNVPCSGCNISSYTNNNVTFGCRDISLIKSTSTATVSSGDDATDDGIGTASASQFGAILALLAAELVSVLSSNPFALDLTKAQGILSFIGCLIFFIFGGIFYFRHWDYLDGLEMLEMRRLQQSVKKNSVLRQKSAEFYAGVDKLADTQLLSGKSNYDFNLKEIFTDYQERNLLGQMNKFFRKAVRAYRSEDPTNSSNIQPKRRKLKYTLSKQYLAVNDFVRSKAILQGKIYEFLEQVAPKDLLKSTHPVKRIVRSVYDLHDFTSMFAYPSLQYTRYSRFLNLVRSILIGLFCDTLFFGIFFPDDGTCPLFLDKTSCLMLFNKATNQPTCLWTANTDPTSSTPGVCSLRPPPGSLMFSLMIALLTVIIGIPIDVSIAYVQDEVCRYRPRFDTWSFDDYNIFSASFWVSARDVFNDLAFNREEDGSEDSMDESEVKAKGTTAKGHKNPNTTDNERDFEEYQAIKHEAMEAYDSFLSVHDEVLIILRRVRQYLSEYFKQSYKMWHGYEADASHGVKTSRSRRLKLNKNNSISMLQARYDEIKLRAITRFLGIQSDGSAVPLTITQSVLYGTPLKRLEIRIENARTLAEDIAQNIKASSEDDDTHADALLLKHFILEQFPFFKRYCLSKQFFVFHDTYPETIDPLRWLAGCFFVTASLSFFVYWIFAWGVKNGGATLTAWGTNYGIGAIQDIFFVQIVKVYIVYVIGIEASRVQLRNIYRVLNDLMMRSASDDLHKQDQNSSNRRNYDLGSLFGQSRYDIEEEEICVVQHMSASCRAAKKYELQNLISSKLLNRMDDTDAWKCKEGIHVNMGFIPFILLAGPILMSLINELLSDATLDIMLPSLFSGFLMFNQFLFDISPILVAVPYILAIIVWIWLYIFLKPSQRRIEKLRKSSVDDKMRKRWYNYLKTSNIGFLRAYVLSLFSWYGDLQAKMVFDVNDLLTLRIFFDKKQRVKQQEIQSLHWRFMNIPLPYQGRVNKSSQKKPLRPISPALVAANSTKKNVSFAVKKMLNEGDSDDLISDIDTKLLIDPTRSTTINMASLMLLEKKKIHESTHVGMISSLNERKSLFDEIVSYNEEKLIEEVAMESPDHRFVADHRRKPVDSNELIFDSIPDDIMDMLIVKLDSLDTVALFTSGDKSKASKETKRKIKWPTRLGYRPKPRENHEKDYLASVIAQYDDLDHESTLQTAKFNEKLFIFENKRRHSKKSSPIKISLSEYRESKDPVQSLVLSIAESYLFTVSTSNLNNILPSHNHENLQKLLQYYYDYEDLLSILRQFFSVFRMQQRDYEISFDDMKDIEEAFIIWIINISNKASNTVTESNSVSLANLSTQGIKLRRFVKWLQGVCQEIQAIKNDSITFDISTSPDINQRLPSPIKKRSNRRRHDPKLKSNPPITKTNQSLSSPKWKSPMGNWKGFQVLRISPRLLRKNFFNFNEELSINEGNYVLKSPAIAHPNEFMKSPTTRSPTRFKRSNQLYSPIPSTGRARRPHHRGTLSRSSSPAKTPHNMIPSPMKTEQYQGNKSKVSSPKMPQTSVIPSNSLLTSFASAIMSPFHTTQPKNSPKSQPRNEPTNEDEVVDSSLLNQWFDSDEESESSLQIVGLPELQSTKVQNRRKLSYNITSPSALMHWTNAMDESSYDSSSYVASSRDQQTLIEQNPLMMKAIRSFHENIMSPAIVSSVTQIKTHDLLSKSPRFARSRSSDEYLKEMAPIVTYTHNTASRQTNPLNDLTKQQSEDNKIDRDCVEDKVKDWNDSFSAAGMSLNQSMTDIDPFTEYIDLMDSQHGSGNKTMDMRSSMSGGMIDDDKMNESALILSSQPSIDRSSSDIDPFVQYIDLMDSQHDTMTQSMDTRSSLAVTTTEISRTNASNIIDQPPIPRSSSDNDPFTQYIDLMNIQSNPMTLSTSNTKQESNEITACSATTDPAEDHPNIERPDSRGFDPFTQYIDLITGQSIPIDQAMDMTSSSLEALSDSSEVTASIVKPLHQSVLDPSSSDIDPFIQFIDLMNNQSNPLNQTMSREVDQPVIATDEAKDQSKIDRSSKDVDPKTQLADRMMDPLNQSDSPSYIDQKLAMNNKNISSSKDVIQNLPRSASEDDPFTQYFELMNEGSKDQPVEVDNPANDVDIISVSDLTQSIDESGLIIIENLNGGGDIRASNSDTIAREQDHHIDHHDDNSSAGHIDHATTAQSAQNLSPRTANLEKDVWNLDDWN